MFLIKILNTVYVLFSKSLDVFSHVKIKLEKSTVKVVTLIFDKLYKVL